MQDFMGVVNGGFANNWAAYLVQLVGPKGAVAILVFTWVDGILCTGVCILSAQRITFAIARDGILPFSKVLSRVTKSHHLPVNACILIAVLSIAIDAAVIGSYVAFSALTAAATVGTNLSYLIPIVARQTLGRNTFQPAKWNLGRWSIPIAMVASGYIMFLFVVLMLPQLYPVDAVSYIQYPAIDITDRYAANLELLPSCDRRNHRHRSWWLVLAIRARWSILVHWAEENDK